LAATVGGVAGSIFAYALAETAYETYDKGSHRAAAPFLVKGKTAQYENLLNEAFTEVKQHPFYETFKKISGYESDEEALSFFKTNLGLGYCFGSVIQLLRLLDKDPDASCDDLLKALDLRQIFSIQLVHFMQGVFQVAEKKVQRELMREQAPSFSNFWNQRQGLPLINEEPSKLEKIKQLNEKIQSLQDIINEMEKSFIPWEEWKTESFPIKESPQAIRMHLTQVIKSQNMSMDSTITGRIILRGDRQDERSEKYSGGHTLVFQCSPGRYRFYDTINAADGGFYEYDDKTEFYEALMKQLLQDLRCKNPHVQLCIKMKSGE
jgi:hypothetical protein